MPSTSLVPLLPYLADVPDPRSAQGRRPSSTAMLAAVWCAILCAARGFKAIAQGVHDQELELVHALGFTRTPPRWGAFRKFLLALNPRAFEAALGRWADAADAALGDASSEAGGLEPTALDGKTARGSLTPHRGAIHLRSLMAHRSGLTLRQQEVSDTTNEHKASLTLIRERVLEGRVLTADAAFCQRDFGHDVLEQGGH